MRRRAFLSGGLLGVAGCSSSTISRVPAPTSPPEPPSPTPTLAAGIDHLETKYGARIGVCAEVEGRAPVGYRAAERFAMCSTFKVLAVAAALRRFTDLDEVVHYSRSDLLEYAPITTRHVATGMTLKALCDAAIRHSDNTAANLLLERTGGPASVTALARSLGDPVTRLDRTEPTLNTAVPGDPRDTTTPAAFAGDLRQLLLGPGAEPLLLGWMTRNTTGDDKIRAGVRSGRPVADKTGSGAYGTSNDVALIRLPSGPPVILTVFTTYPSSQNATPEPTLIKQATSLVLGDLPAP